MPPTSARLDGVPHPTPCLPPTPGPFWGPSILSSAKEKSFNQLREKKFSPKDVSLKMGEKA